MNCESDFRSKSETSPAPVRIKYLIYSNCGANSLIADRDNLSSPLNNQALLPLTLTATTQPQALLQQVVERVNQLERRERLEISAYTQILAGLKYEKDLIRKLFREGMMRESVIYQEILAEGEQRGEQRERSLIVRQLTRRVGELPQEMREQIESLDLEQLENLREALLDFQAMPTAVNYADLKTWFNTLEQKGQ